MSQSYRLASGGAIDRSRTLRFTFDGKAYEGHPGDTLASALLANGVRLVGRSFKYHRPRGIIAAGAEEPNALVTLGEGGLTEPNVRASVAELYDGLVARSQNAWPSLGFDIGAVNGLLSPFFPAGFYYKTFLGPAKRWTHLYEPFIRRAAGLGPAPTHADPEIYDKIHAHCDLLIVGAGPAGLSAALAAGRAGVRILLVDEQTEPGGSLLARSDADKRNWKTESLGELASLPNVRILSRTTLFGRYDDGLLMAVERLQDHVSPADRKGARQRLWQIRARQTILATGAHQQPLVFANNDLPGVMLADAAHTYAKRWGVLAGHRVAIGTGDDSAYAVAAALRDAGAEVFVADVRAAAPSLPGIEIETGAVIRGARGFRAVAQADIAAGDRKWTRNADAILMAGGWQPALHLHSHLGGKAGYDARRGCFVPVAGTGGAMSVGACAGEFAHELCLALGAIAGQEAAEGLGFASTVVALPAPAAEWARAPVPPQPGTSFVDFQNDVKLADIDLAAQEGFVSVEHLKRYTTTGMATDQGKLSNLNALTRLGETLGIEPGKVGTTTFRPPYTPVTLGALAALDRGNFIDPIRTTPMHAWHVEQGAIFEDVGQWKRPHFYPRGGEDMHAAVKRECEAVRAGVGMLDASTLGKIDVQGPDAAKFLNLVYTNAWLKLEIGRCRYGLMCREDGMLFDDGVTARTGEQRFLMTTTTGNAARVLDHLEDYLQTEFPDLKVYLTSVTEHWAATVVTGPRAREVIARIAQGVDLSNEAFPHLSMRECTLTGGIPARLYRISFTGELSFEVHVPAQHGLAAWRAVHEAGQLYGITPYGTETMHVLRAEKGYIIIGQETDGTVSPLDLGLGWAIAKAKPDYVGKRSLARPDMLGTDRKQLVGLLPVDGATVLEEGAQLTARDAGTATPVPMQGHVTSSYWSMVLNAPFALALLKGGQARHGEEVLAHFEDKRVLCRVCEPVFHDPSGELMNG
jgi:sarcosine oxidase subunit alpha